MKYYHKNDEIDEIGEGLVRQFDFDSYSNGHAVDIEKFITDYLKYRIVYDNIAESDASKTAFLGDGKAGLCVWRNGRRESIVPPDDLIVVDSHFSQNSMTTQRRFMLAHEAGHIIMDKLCGNTVEAAYNNEFDGEREYSLQELGELFSIKETQATSMGVALLLPKTLVTSLLMMLKEQRHIPIYGNNVLLDRDRKIIGDMAEHFKVSYKSMFYRMRSLKLFEYRLIDEYIAMNLGGNGWLPC